ncbi:MAG: DUF1640 domain-containing protein [Acidobacteriota bacterium]|nr:DUF1640 domain-containing protein [Acidobacteriota bacterium]
MTTAVFDTLKASDTLKAAGIEAKQAEAIVHTMAGAFEDTVATKADLIEVKAELKQDIVSTRAEVAIVKGDIRLLKWMNGVVMACVAFPILKSFLL